MTVAISGKSSTGKSTVSQLLSAEMGWRVIHCGEIVKVRSESDHMSPYVLGLDVHRQIDQETRSAIDRSAGRLIVEGTFIAHVVTSVPMVRLIELTCLDKERSNRFSRKTGQPSTGLANRDLSDSTLSMSLYGASAPRTPDLIVDTTELSAMDVVDEIMKWVNELGYDRHDSL